MSEQTKFEKTVIAIAKASGTPASLVVHTIFFVGIFALYFAGVPFDTILLVLTTILSVEAIYLGVLNQMITTKAAEVVEEKTADVNI